MTLERANATTSRARAGWVALAASIAMTAGFGLTVRGAEDGPAVVPGSGEIGPWIATSEVYAVTDSALLLGADFGPSQSLHLTILDPDGGSTTWALAADAEGRLAEPIPVDIPGMYTAEIRDDGGALVSSCPIFVAGS